jgi:hypothetical protein
MLDFMNSIWQPIKISVPLYKKSDHDMLNFRRENQEHIKSFKLSRKNIKMDHFFVMECIILFSI